MTGLGRTSVGAAGLVLGTAVVFFGATLTDAIRVEEPTTALEGLSPPVTAGEEPGAMEAGRPLSIYPRISQTELLDAVNQDLFQPDRLPPPEGYQLPGERRAVSVVQQDSRRRRGPELRVVGSAVMGDLALALIQVDDSVPLAVLLGESLEGYTLVAVNQETATLTSLTETLTLPVVEPLARGGTETGPVQIRIDSRDIEQLRSRAQEIFRGQMMNRGGQVPPGGTNPPGRGGRGGGGGQS